MPNPNGQNKPVVDAVNDAVSALSDLVRSIRGARKQRSRGPDLKQKVRGAAAEVKSGARGAAHDVKRAGKSLKSHFERAWDALVGHNRPKTRRAPKSRARA